MEQHLAGRQWFMDDDFTIADISMLGWVRNLIGFYGARDLVAFDDLRHVAAWLERGLARPAVQRGLEIPKRPGSGQPMPTEPANVDQRCHEQSILIGILL